MVDGEDGGAARWGDEAPWNLHRRDKARILLVGDNATELERCREALAGIWDFAMVAESKSSTAVKLLGSDSFDLVVTDLRMPMVDGLDILRIAHSLDPDMPVVIMTGDPSVDTAVSALRDGAADCCPKPVNLDDLVTVAGRLLETRRLRGEHHLLAVTRSGEPRQPTAAWVARPPIVGHTGSQGCLPTVGHSST